jgi:aspartate racemase
VNGWRTIGVIGGMGPAATADFLTRLVAAVGAADDRGHPRILVDSNPQVPDRNAARRGEGPSPGPALAAMARGLEAQGAELLAMPCNAAHGWADEIRTASRQPFIDMVEAAAGEAAATGARRIGVIAVDATLESRLYHRPLEAAGLALLAPDATAVRRLVQRVKAGETGPDPRREARAIAEALAAAGAGAVIAACTEIPLVLDAGACPVPFIDSTAALVRATIAAARR